MGSWGQGLRVVRAVVLLAMCLVPLAAEAKKAKKPPEPDRSMQFAIVRGSSALCEPNCPEWIWAEGEIRPDTVTRFRKFLKTVGKRKLPVIIQSPGGDVDAALAMGRVIRARKLDVAVGYTSFSSCVPRQKNCDAAKKGGYTGIAAVGFAYCNSACPLVLAGGTRRLVGSWAEVAVHQITTTMFKENVVYETTTRIVNGKKVTRKKVVSRQKAGSYKTTKMTKALRRQLETYLAEMGVSKELLKPINETPAAELLRLGQVEMLGLKLITSMDQLDLVAGLTICKAEPAPANCRVDKSEVAKAIVREQAAKEKAAKEQAASVQAVAAAAATETAKSAPSDEDAAWVALRQGAEKSAALLEKWRSLQDDPSGNTSRDVMHFVLARASDPLCDPNCPEWISAEGTVTSRTPDAFAAFLKRIDGRRPPVIVHSKGGDLLGAMALGRLIRKNQLDAAVGKTHFLRCEPDAEGCKPVDGAHAGAAVDQGAECHAACSLVLAGGVRRYVGSAHVSVRMLALEAQVRSYLTEMSIGWRLMALMKSTMYRPLKLDRDMMLDMNLASSPENVAFLTHP